ncbi:MAG TPA: selenocysteine-specific translation elongation factor [Vicinamibacterales bacterium]|jgi:selenocysteine-specific elongation factor|nr:selenocysteine-specific translation elongation factor [Vicinamibacterales bacterium]
MTRSLVIGTAGHIDHGKSTLVRALTGIDPDRLKEEQERGITIDLGFAHYEAGGVTYAFVDVPGHERFVKNMLAGVGGIDCILLVIAADESVKPQTREHFDICRLLRVRAGMVVLTKADLVDADTLELVTLETRDLVAGTFLERAPIIPVSATRGDGLQTLRDALIALAGSLPASSARRPDAPARLPIDRVFTIRGFGTVVTGTLTSGTIRAEQEMVILPAGRSIKVRGVQVHGRPAVAAEAGQRAAVNLAAVEVSDLRRGDTLSEEGSLEVSRRLDVVVDLLGSAPPLKQGARLRLHQGTSELLGRISIAGGGTIEPGARGYARIRLESPAVVTRGDRFILRAYSPPRTIGGGEVLDPSPPRSAIRSPAGLARFACLDRAAQDAEEAASIFIEEAGAAGLPRRALTSRAGIAPADASGCIDRLARAGRVLDLGERLVARGVIAALSDRVKTELAAHHAAQPLSDGIPREELRGKLFRRAHAAVFDHVIERLAAESAIAARDRLALASHRPSLSSEETAARDAVDNAYREAALAPPDAVALAASLNLSPPVVDRVTKLLLRQKTLLRVDDLIFHSEALARLRSGVAALKGAAGQPIRIDVAAFKERYGISRKYAIPLLEYLDRERVTRRVGDSRVVI